MFQLQEFKDRNGRSPFGRWFDSLGPQAAAKVTTALTRMEAGNFSNAKSVGAGVSEIRIHTGPGYRVYYGREGKSLVILLGGGTKSHQRSDIATAKANWQDYKDSIRGN